MGEAALSANETMAPLQNVSLFSQLVSRVQSRRQDLPGLGCFYGPSGYGKTKSAIYAANKYRAYHVQVGSTWTQAKLCRAILAEIGIVQPRTRVYDMVDQIAGELVLSRRPLIIDEADYLVSKGMIEVVKDIYENCYAAILLIGEEALPAKLKASERVHGRMLDWVAAQPASLADARHLTRFYCPGIAIADDLLASIHEAAKGSVRRIVVNLDRVREHARTLGVAAVDAKLYQLPFFTGDAPSRKAA